MKYAFVLILIVSSVLFAQPTEQDNKAVQDAGESIGVDLSFSREANINNIEKLCQESFKTTVLSVKKTPEVEAKAVMHCVSQWKSLR